MLALLLLWFRPRFQLQKGQQGQLHFTLPASFPSWPICFLHMQRLCLLHARRLCLLRMWHFCFLHTWRLCLLHMRRLCLLHTWRLCLLQTQSLCLRHTRSLCLRHTRRLCLLHTWRLCLLHTRRNNSSRAVVLMLPSLFLRLLLMHVVIARSGSQAIPQPEHLAAHSISTNTKWALPCSGSSRKNSRAWLLHCCPVLLLLLLLLDGHCRSMAGAAAAGFLLLEQEKGARLAWRRERQVADGWALGKLGISGYN
mmetsp:Transcript_17943/g.50147  ORF Transcript_17943/g.50147 Transcript_17943/m.50147 type:complete len:253 (-) Transcript_17943:535-1293(-)